MDKADDLYTQEQHNYVDSLGEHELRAALLHQLRLRDLMSRDRDLFERRCYRLEDQLTDLKKEGS